MKFFDIFSSNILCQIGTLVNLKAMVAPVQKVTMEDKENFDPRSATTTSMLISTTSKKAPQTTEKIENEANSVMQDADSDISSDGFDVSEGLELDEASLSDDENSQGKKITFKRYASTSELFLQYDF